MKNKFLLSVILLLAITNLVHSQHRGLELGDILWQVQVPDNPGTSFQDKQIKSLKQIPDINGDGVNDVVVATNNYWTLCYSGINGTLLWQFSTHFGMINTGSVDWEAAMAIADVNNDGIFDVVIGCAGGNEMVYALNGANGNLLWSYGNPTTTNDGDIKSISIKYDFNNDGINDVLVSASGVTGGGRHAAICLNAVNGEVIFYTTQPQPFTDVAIATESGGAIGANNNGAPYFINGLDTNGLIVWNYTVPSVTWSLKEIPDINGDGGKDIIGLSGFSGAVYAITGNSGAQIWTASLGSSNNGNIVLLDDLDGNGFIDFSLSAPSTAYRLDSKTGNILWSNSLGSSFLRGIDNIGDINSDGIDDIVIATQMQPRLLVLNGADGSILFDYSFGSTLNQRGDRAAVLDDIDSNGVNEFLGGNREGRVICFYGGDGIITNIEQNVETPNEFQLFQNFPNPFNPTTQINFNIPLKSFVRLQVFDILGREVAELHNSTIEAGSHSFTFDASKLSGGIYFYTLSTGEIKMTKRMVLIK